MAEQILNKEEVKPAGLEYSAKDIQRLIAGRTQSITDYKANYDKWWNAYKGKSWWAQDLPQYKTTDTDNQIFPIIQSIIGYLSKTQVHDRIIPPSDDAESLRIADKLTNAATDFWRVNRRAARIQDWLRVSTVKGDCYFYIRVEPEADYPFLVDALDPIEIIEASDTIEYIQHQPWIVRVVKANVGYVKSFSKDEKLVNYFKLNYKTDDEEVIMYDFWSKVGGGQNTLLTANGATIYERPWPFKAPSGFITSTLYPFAQLKDISLSSMSRSLSSVDTVCQLQKIYDKQKAQIWENAEYMGNPPIVVDVESGIDTAKIEGKPRLIIKKYRDGNFTIVPVPPLPGYVERGPEVTRQSIQRNLGWSQLMESGSAGSAREKGAVKALQLSGFASMDPKLKNLIQLFDDINNILIGLLKTYEFSARKALSYRSGLLYQEFSPSDIKGIYQSRVTVDGADPEKEQKRIYEIQTNYKMGLISRKYALMEMGEENVDAIIKSVYEERALELEFEAKKAEYIQKQQQTMQPQTTVENTTEVTPGEVPTFNREKTTETVEKPVPVSGNYVDFLGRIIMSALRSRLSSMTFREPIEIVEPNLGAINADQVKLYVPLEIDRVRIVEAMPDIAPKIIFTSMKPGPGSSIPVTPEASPVELPAKSATELPAELPVIEKKNENPEVVESESAIAEPAYVTRGEILAGIKKGIIKGIDLKSSDVKKYEGMTGLYLVEPHAEMVYNKQKKLILKGRPYPNMLDKDFILIGDKAYGIIRLTYGGKLKKEDVIALEGLHRVSEGEWKKWWGDKDLYAYTYVFKKFPEPIAYEKKAGIQTFQNDVKFIEAKVEEPQAAVITGGLKVTEVKPGKAIEPAKPEKKALTTNEVYSVDRLKEILPTEKHPQWDVSEKLDGIRCTAHKIGKEVIFMSDEAKTIDAKRLKSIADAILKTFPYDIVLDGELMMFNKAINLKHQAIAGYIHSNQEPTKEELDGLVYKIFDALYVRNSDISKKPFEARGKVLDLFLKGDTGPIQRAKHDIVSVAQIPDAFKRLTSDEGVVVRAADSSYWHTALMFKVKKMFDIDVKVLKKEVTKNGANIFYCTLADGTYAGKTYGQKYVDAKPGDTIRINVEHITLRPSGQLSWFAPKPTSKKGLDSGAGPSATTPGVNRADSLAQIKEVFLAQGGTEKEWTDWLPKFETWKKESMPKLLAKIK